MDNNLVESGLLKDIVREDFLGQAQWLKPIETQIEFLEWLTSFDTKILTIGSCFAQNIQSVLQHYSFDVYFERDICAHYSADSILYMLKNLKRKKTVEDLFFYRRDGTDVGAMAYNRVRYFGEDAVEKCIQRCAQLDNELIEQIKTRDFFIFTLGTVYSARDNKGRVICSFYGFSTDHVEWHSSTASDVQVQLEDIYETLVSIRGNSNFKLVLTVSPQRYNWSSEITGKGFLQQNAFSKSSLLIGVDAFLEQHKENACYFPAYELVVDELRLYETLSTYDHLHINDSLTPKYVVKRFLKAYSSEHVLKGLVLLESLSYLNDHTKSFIDKGLKFNDPALFPYWEKIRKDIEQLESQDSSLGLMRTLISKLSFFANLPAGKPDRELTEWFEDLGVTITNNELLQKIELINAIEETKKIVVWGGGEILTKLYQDSLLTKKNIVAIVDKTQQEKTLLYGVPLCQPEVLSRLNPDLVVIASLSFYEEIRQSIREINAQLLVV